MAPPKRSSNRPTTWMCRPTVQLLKYCIVSLASIAAILIFQYFTGALPRHEGVEGGIHSVKLHDSFRAQQESSNNAVITDLSSKKPCSNVYLDWEVSSSKFTNVNYRALESVLAVYGSSRVQVMLAGPYELNYYKWRNTLRY